MLAQCDGRVGAFVCGVGTGGTITGVGRFLRSHCPGAQIVLADPVGSRLAHLVDRGASGSRCSLSGRRDRRQRGARGCATCRVIDAAERVTDEESFAMTGRLLREEGLLVGVRPGRRSWLPCGWPPRVRRAGGRHPGRFVGQVHFEAVDAVGNVPIADKPLLTTVICLLSYPDAIQPLA